MSQYKPSDTDIELESLQYSSEAATEVAAIVTVLNVLKLADVLSPQPRPGANRDDCAVVWVVPPATNARAGSCRSQFGCAFTCKLELGPLTRVQHGESGLGGISACALSRIVSAPRNGLIGIRVIL